eukprot:gnl/TRDRNA2_/TRDRNA2_55718_c0_seq1.p1 gnl/TRDRNA2_/TRDRNA2_55718_c0~~gnl/TRDRNA2_/TRDRNA2_55718_c0_seq1.p1  ORF type:complete len:367 (+),score=56.04 gnl/TRDRNA2_/TRDRNA2_55718_c0_seq1:53-1102(+)
MAAKVAPEQQVMTNESDLKPQPSIPGNGCCCACCGKAPGPVDWNKITADGGKFIQVADGRIVEYFVYGSEAPDARVLLEVNGSMGTGRMFSQFSGITEKLKEHNIKGIAITVPGFAYSTLQLKRKICNWPKDDVEPVLAAEGVTGNFMVEGVSFGTAHAMAVAHYFGERVTAMHVIVPYLPIPIRKEMNWAEYMGDDGLKCGEEYASKCSSCCLFCLCSTLRWCVTNNPSSTEDKDTKELDKAIPGSFKITTLDVVRSGAHSVHGWLYNAFVPMVSGDWGFDPREIKTSKVIVSYAEGDKQCDPEHGKFLADYFGKKASAIKVNVSSGSHSSHGIAQVRGEFITQIASI